MVQYNPKDWITFIFRFHKSDSFRQLIPMMITIGLYSFLICFLKIEYFKIDHSDNLKNINIMHGLISFVISLLLVFRTNTAYDRWWEGRKLWGSLVNNSRNLAIKLAAMLNDEHDRNYFKTIIPMYASIMQKHLADEEIALMLYEDLNLKIDTHLHRPNQVAKYIFQKVTDLYKSGKITGDQLIILNNELQAFTDICGGCERIKNTPIPYSYSSFIKKFIFIYIMTLPFGYVYSLGYYTIPIVVFVFYVLASLELIAEEIEDPFGNDSNDLPTKKLASNIKKHVEEIFG
jgi:ion channel-forming bestrophin family protein